MNDSLYDRNAVKPMSDELNAVGVASAETPEQVDAAIEKAEGVVMVVVNSVCGCAAGNARPGVTRALQHALIPDRCITVFAGVDRAATDRARHYMSAVPPSSPSIGLFKDGQLVGALERRHIERMTEVDVAKSLTEAFDKYCTATGPSVPPEVYEQVKHAKACGKSIPANPMMPGRE